MADSLERWVDAGADDGFILMEPSLPDGLEDFVDQVVPLLQTRGRVRTAYDGRTLREHLGLHKPLIPPAFCALAASRACRKAHVE